MKAKRFFNKENIGARLEKIDKGKIGGIARNENYRAVYFVFDFFDQFVAVDMRHIEISNQHPDFIGMIDHPTVGINRVIEYYFFQTNSGK